MMKRYTVSTFLICILFGAFLVEAHATTTLRSPETGELVKEMNYTNVTVSVAKQLMDSNDDLMVIDVRTKKEYNTGHIEGSILIPLSSFKNNIKKLDANAEILIYCKSGIRSASACKILVEEEFTNIHNMIGGIEAWKDAGYPVTQSSSGNMVQPNHDCKSCSLKRENSRSALETSVKGTENREVVLDKVKDEIAKKGSKWVAGETSVSELPLEKKKLLCGSKFDPILNELATMSSPIGEIPFGTFDWRNVNGTNWVTPVKDQGACGSCWAFGTLGSMEAVINIENKDPDIDEDLSEQFLVSCCDECGSCSGGSPQRTYDFVQDTGVITETCFPYVAADVPCTPCISWEDELWKIGDWYRVSNDTNSIKYALQTYGPLGVGMWSPDDFLYYMSGVYEPVWSSPEWDEIFPYGSSNHWVTLVGYNDTGEYWIIKNSWGTGWGEEGYGKIAYGVLESHDYIFAITSVEEPIPPEHSLIVTLQTPTYLLPESTSVLNATVYNFGLHHESNVELYLYINGSIVNSTTIPELVIGSSHMISYLWAPIAEETYNITAFSPPVNGENRTSNNVVTEHVVQSSQFIAIFKNRDPWGSESIEEICSTNDLPYVVFDSGYFGTLNLSRGFSKVIIASDQDQEFYDDVDVYKSWFEDYVSQGGVLEIHAADRGWNGGNWIGTLPGGFVVEPSYLEEIDIELVGHPLLLSPHVITDEELDNWSSSVHGLFTSIPLSSRIILVEHGSRMPVLVESYFGDGSIIASTQTLEFAYERGYSNILENIILRYPVRPQHDLAVNLDVPVYLIPGEETQANLTVYNQGMETENDVTVHLYVNGTNVLDQTIPTLTKGTSTTLSYPWTPPTGLYNVTAYVEPVTGENYTVNNRVYRWVDVSYTPTHVGDIVLEGDDVLVIEDVYFTQRGSIYVRDNAQLVIWNATLNLDQDDWGYQYEIVASGSASLWTEDAYIVSNYNFDTRLVGHAEVLLNTTFFGESWDDPPVYSIGYVYVEDDAVLDVDGSTLSYLRCFDNSTVSIYGSDLRHLDCYGYSTVNVYGSDLDDVYCYEYSTVNVYGSDLDDVYCYEYSTVNVYDSVIDWSVYVNPWGAPDVLLQGCTVEYPCIGFSESAFSSGMQSMDPTKQLRIEEHVGEERYEGEPLLHGFNGTSPHVRGGRLDPYLLERSVGESSTDSSSDGPPDLSSPAVVTLTGINPGYIGFWNIHLNETVSGVDWNLTLADTTIGYGWDIGCYDDSQVSIHDSTLDYLGCYDYSDVSVYDSTLDYVSCYDSSTASIYNSEMFGVYVNPWGDPDVYLEGCTVEHPRLTFVDASVATLTDIRSGYIGYWNIHVNGSVSGVGWDLTLADTMVTYGWDIGCSGDSQVSIHGSTLDYLWCYDYSEVSVYDSTLDYLRCYDYSLVSVYNSSIYRFYCRYFYGQILFDEGVVDGYLDMSYSDFYLEGNVNFTSVEMEFYNSRVIRNYGVEVTMNGAPASDVELTLYDEWETPIWTGVTDASGQADFNMTYVDGNYTATYTLRMDDYPLESEVTLTSNTPIVFEIYGHDLAVGLEAPMILLPGMGTQLNMTVYNQGMETETDVAVHLYVNGTTVLDQTIPTLENGTSTTLSHSWNPSPGLYNVTAYVEPVPGEDQITNNLVTRMVYVGEKIALISYYSELVDITGILDSMGSVYDIYNDNYADRYTEDLDLLLDYQTVIYNNRHGLTSSEYAVLKSYLSLGGNLLVTGFDSLISDSLLADLVCSSSTGDNMGEPDLYVVDPFHPLMDGPYGSFPEGYHVNGLYSDCDAVEADTSRGAVTVAELEDGYDKIIATQVPPGKVVYWNGKGPSDWTGNTDCEAMFKNTIVWLEARYQHDLGVSLETPLYILPGDGRQLNVTVSNYGLEDESDVRVRLLVNETTLIDEMIPILVNGTSTTLSYSCIPSPGLYNVTAYVEPVPGENYTVNNRDSDWVDVSYTPTHVGDLVVDGDDVLIIEDVYFTQKGNVSVRDNATLIIRNATLNLDQDRSYHDEIRVSDSATLWTEDAYIVSKYNFDTFLVGSSESLFNATFFGESWDDPPVYSIGNVYVENEAILNVYGSTLSYLDCFDNSTVNVYGSDLEGLYCFDYSVVSVYDSTIEWSIYVGPWGAPDVLLEGCTVEYPRIGFWGTASTSGIQSMDPTRDALIHEDGFLEAFAGEKGEHPHTLDETTPGILHESWLDPSWRERSNKEEYTQNATSDVTLGASSSAVVTLTGLHPGLIGYWNIHLNETVSGVDWNLTLVNTEVIEGWFLSCYGESEVSVYDSILFHLYCNDDSVVSVYDSTIEGAVYVSPWGGSDVLLEGCTVLYPELDFGESSSAFLSDLNTGLIGFWNIHLNETVSGVDWNLTIVETTVTGGWGIGCYGDSEVSIYDSTLLVLDCVEYSSVSVYDSTLRYLFCHTEQLVSVYNSSILDYFECDWFYGQLLFDNATVYDYWDVYCSDFYMEGGVNFTDVDLWFHYSRVTRNYGVDVAMDGFPSPGVALTLYDEWGTPIWTGVTDASGHADFNITYVDGNYTSICELYLEDEYLTNVDILSVTPILCSLGPQITLSAQVGPVGSIVAVNGTGFIPEGNITRISIDSLNCTIIGTVNIGAGGNFSTSLVIPSVTNTGVFMIEVADDGGRSATADFEVSGLSEVEVDPFYCPPETTVSVHGYNYSAISGETVSVELWRKDPLEWIMDLEAFATDADGEFNGNITIPVVDFDNYLILAFQDQYSINATCDLRVGIMVIMIIPTSGPTGTRVQLTGAGFTPYGEWNATFGDIPIFQNETVDASGIITGVFYVPEVEPGAYFINVTDIDGGFVVYTLFDARALVNVHIDSGWSLVSVPFGNTSIQSVFGEELSQIEIIFGYYNGSWKYWFPGNPTNTLKEFQCGLGYWVKSITEFNLTLTGVICDAMPFNPEWNLIGTNLSDPISTEEYLEGTSWTMVHGYEKGVWYYFIRDVGGALNTLQPGEGYWVLTEF